MQKYRIISRIGQGSYGTVLKCLDMENNEHVAIKKFKDTDEDQSTRKTTLREVKLLNMLEHPNVVKMREAFRKKGVVFLVFQFVEQNLLEVMERAEGGVESSIIRKLMFQLMKGLAYLHGQGVIHRDIKPENLLVSAKYDLKICDFGFARHIKKEKGELELTDYVATRWYRPPQLLVGGEYGQEIDMWAMGCIMCELIDGNPLFPGENDLDQLFLIQKTLGPLPDHLFQRFLKNQQFLGMKFPEIQNLDSIDKKYFGKIDHKGLALIKSLLKLSPTERITAEQALNHPYFDAEKPPRQMNSQMGNYRKQIQASTQKSNKLDHSLAPNLDNPQKPPKFSIKQKPSNPNAISQAFQSYNPNKQQPQPKSTSKPPKKKSTALSIEKPSNQNLLLLKTESRAFHIPTPDNLPIPITVTNNTQNRKRVHIGWQSTNQLPFLLNSVNGHVDGLTTAQPEIGNRTSLGKKRYAPVDGLYVSVRSNRVLPVE